MLLKGELAHRDKAAFALARFLSPGQPESCRVTPALAYGRLGMLLERLLRQERDARVLISLAGCLYQILAWEPVSQVPIPAPPASRFCAWQRGASPHTASLARFPDIEMKCDTRFELIPKLLSWSTATRDEQRQIQEFLLEVVEGE